jgi:hypothetical protein
MPAGAKPAGGSYAVHVSQKTGLYYFFADGESLWHDASLPSGWGWKKAAPTDQKTYVNLFTRAEQSVAPTAPAAAASATAAPTVVTTARPPAPAAPFAPYAALNAGVCAAGGNVVALRAAAEALCVALAGGALASPPGCPPGLHRFPPLAKLLRAVCHELADEFGLRSESAGEEPDGRHVVAWRRDTTGPPEAAAAAEEEAALAALAAARVAAERAADAARAAAEAAAAGGGAAAPPKMGAKRMAAGAGGGADEGEEELVAVVPVAPEKLDRRDYKEIREEIQERKRARIAAEAAAAAAAAPASRGGGGGGEDEEEEEEDLECG